MDLSIAITDKDGERWRRLVATQEELHAGHSTAADACAAAHLLASGRLPAEVVAVTVLFDTGLKY